jgi:AbrB family looped-hinge helix DNA binding protein
MYKDIDSLAKVTSKGQITIPAIIRKQLNIGKGDHVRFRVQDGAIVLEAVAVVDRSQAWFWTPQWQAAEQEASDDIKAGRVSRFNSADEAIRALDSPDDAVG